MKDRLKEVRKSQKLTQADFANKLGVSVNNIINYENGRRIPSSAAIQNIVRTFNVNETWLLTGEGEMLGSVTREQEIASITAQLFKEEDNSFRLKLIKLISQMSDDDMERCKAFIETLLK